MLTIPSLAKIVVAVGAIALILWVFRKRDRATRKDTDDNLERPRRRRAAEKTAVHPTHMCRVCDAYVLRGEACTRPDCPNQQAGPDR